MAISRNGDDTAGEACSTLESAAQKGWRGWLMELPIIGALICCPGPLWAPG